MFDYWYLSMPTGMRERKESLEDAVNRELNELVLRGWEPLSVTRPTNIDKVGFLLRRPKETA